MRLVTQTECPAKRFGDEECVRILAKAGFDAVDWSFFEMLNDDCHWCGDGWEEHAKRLKAVGDECGIGFAQAHAPFPSSKGEEPFDSVIRERILRAMRAAAIMGVEKIVVHPLQHLTYAQNRRELYDMNIRFYRSLVPYCEEYGIRVCVENMWQYDQRRRYIVDSVCAQPDEFCSMLDDIGSEWIVGCLDIGHSALVGIEPADFIRAMGSKRLRALHVHDVNYVRDCHTMPFVEKLDWESIAAALGEIGYEGDFTFEADNFLYPFPKELEPDASALMAKVGRYLISRIEAHREARGR